MTKIFQALGAYIRLILYLLKTFIQLLYGIWRISRLSYAPVTIFGGTYLRPESIYLKQANKLAHMLAQHNIPVLTGGGPGIMEAANCGARGKDPDIISTIGIGVEGLTNYDEAFNKCATNNLKMANFASRKWPLISYSVGFAVFPGGFGTVNELTELLTLIQTKRRMKAPIVLIGTKYWAPFMDWLINSAQAEGLIKPEDAELFILTDDLDYAFSLLDHHVKKINLSVFEAQQ